MGYPSNLILAIQERRHIRWRICLPLILLVLTGSIPGALFLRHADAGLIKLLFGFVIILIGVEMLFRDKHPDHTNPSGKSRLMLGLIGLLSGLLCGLYGIGALLGAYVSRVTRDSHSFRGNLCMVFFAESTFRIFLYSYWGILTPDILLSALQLVPFMGIGLALGMMAGRRLNEALARYLVVIMLILSGISLVLSNLSAVRFSG